VPCGGRGGALFRCDVCAGAGGVMAAGAGEVCCWVWGGT